MAILNSQQLFQACGLNVHLLLPNNCGEKWAEEWGSKVVTMLESKGDVLTLWPSLGLFWPRPYATLAHKLFLSDFIPGILSSLWNFCFWSKTHTHTLSYMAWLCFQLNVHTTLEYVQIWGLSKLRSWQQSKQNKYFLNDIRIAHLETVEYNISKEKDLLACCILLYLISRSVPETPRACLNHILGSESSIF